MYKLLAIFSLPLLLAGLSGCGGGGGGGGAPAGPVTSTLSFPLQSAENTFVANGVTKTFTVAGTCSGTGSMSVAPAATGATFEGAAALSMVQTITISYTNCTPASIASTATSYFNSSYVQLGLNIPGSVYGVFLVPPIIPTSVTVGGTGIVGTLTLYTDSTKAIGSGRLDLSYVIEPDTSTTAIVNKIIKTYNAAGTLTQTAQGRARIAMVGATTPISLDTQAANGSTTHLVWTFN